MKNTSKLSNDFQDRILNHLKIIYGGDVSEEFARKLFVEIGNHVKEKTSSQKWDENDVVLITYGDSIRNDREPGLLVLNRFLKEHLSGELSIVHILPFFPYSSDDGFSVIDYKKVSPEIGDWEHVISLGNDFKLMFDLVINHISKNSEWFQNYLSDIDPGKDYFIEADPDTDLSDVVRPRSRPLLTEFKTKRGEKYVWTTFSEDQIDLNFANPAVLFEMIRVLLWYLDNGASMIRLDAIAFLWKTIGTSCVHLPQTHEVVKLLRDIMEAVDPSAIVLTETNVPNKENLSYFGNGDEAHMVYQFSLPPLLLHAFYNGNAEYFNKWASEIPVPQNGCTFFNFTASHDGIGVRPLEGLLPPEELNSLIDGVKASGGSISTRRNSDGSDSPYEMNITYFDAMKRTCSGEDGFQEARFLASQTVMMEMKGIPAFYIHSFLSAHNYIEGVKKTGRARTINRRKWDEKELETLLAKDNAHSRILKELKRRIRIRKSRKAFHPDGAQEVLDFGKNIIAIKRKAVEGEQEVWCITNVSKHQIHIPVEHFEDGMPKFNILRNACIDVEDDGLYILPYETVWLV